MLKSAGWWRAFQSFSMLALCRQPNGTPHKAASITFVAMGQNGRMPDVCRTTRTTLVWAPDKQPQTKSDTSHLKPGPEPGSQCDPWSAKFGFNNDDHPDDNNNNNGCCYCSSSYSYYYFYYPTDFCSYRLLFYLFCSFYKTEIGYSITEIWL